MGLRHFIGMLFKIIQLRLKEGYNKGQYPILDAVLQDFDVSYRMKTKPVSNMSNSIAQSNNQIHVGWESPSIALVKYWGKYGRQ